MRLLVVHLDPMVAKICLGSTSLQLRRDIVIWNAQSNVGKAAVGQGRRTRSAMQFRTWIKQFAPPRATVKVEYEREPLEDTRPTKPNPICDRVAPRSEIFHFP